MGLTDGVAAQIKVRELQDEIERLRAALESIARNTCCDKCQEAALVAKSALNQQITEKPWPLGWDGQKP